MEILKSVNSSKGQGILFSYWTVLKVSILWVYYIFPKRIGRTHETKGYIYVSKAF